MDNQVAAGCHVEFSIYPNEICYLLQLNAPNLYFIYPMVVYPVLGVRFSSFLFILFYNPWKEGKTHIGSCLVEFVEKYGQQQEHQQHQQQHRQQNQQQEQQISSSRGRCSSNGNITGISRKSITNRKSSSSSSSTSSNSSSSGTKDSTNMSINIIRGSNISIIIGITSDPTASAALAATEAASS
ncbi:hypothetical protein ACSSS7_003268 [Eimeria intestinalis]